jgi:sugar lactone lactonase YvrE
LRELPPSDTASELLRVQLPTSHITNVAFGSADMRTLLSPARASAYNAQMAGERLAGALFAVDTDARGLPANAFAG